MRCSKIAKYCHEIVDGEVIPDPLFIDTSVSSLPVRASFSIENENLEIYLPSGYPCHFK
jgi:hypothetical protein